MKNYFIDVVPYDRIKDGIQERQDFISTFHWDCPFCGTINDYEDFECTECEEPDERMLSLYGKILRLMERNQANINDLWRCPMCDAPTDTEGMCGDCLDEQEKMYSMVGELTLQGCSHHCACRQVMGDGECECSRETYDRNWWVTAAKRGLP